MTHIDHAAKAQELQRAARSISAQKGVAPHMAAVILLDDARLETQLALVEQQRIANMQAERQSLRARAIGRQDAEAARMTADADALDVKIREALGLT